ncbi:MAG: S1 family peptidase [Polyangiaceae bacterium]|nr:S1 family peptidase [Polyangiaceae bacterium]
MSTHRASLSLLLFLAAVSACESAEFSAVAPSAITQGEPAPADVAGAALSMRTLACDSSPGAVLCSGVFVAPDRVLTAGHCVEPYKRGLLEVWSAPDNSHPDVFRAGVRALVVHPSYTETASDFDGALLFLTHPASVSPWPMWEGAIDSTWVGREVRLVGFGETELNPENAQRRSTTAEISQVNEHTFQLAPKPGLTCRGDSGGPVLTTVNGTEYLIGITSAGDPDCEKTTTATRVDGLKDVLQASAPPNPVIPQADICEAPCSSDLECPDDLVCQQGDDGVGRCSLSTLGSSRFAAACTEDTDCETSCVRLGASCRCATSCLDSTEVVENGCNLRGGSTDENGTHVLIAALCLCGVAARRRRRAV